MKYRSKAEENIKIKEPGTYGMSQKEKNVIPIICQKRNHTPQRIPPQTNKNNKIQPEEII